MLHFSNSTSGGRWGLSSASVARGWLLCCPVLPSGRLPASDGWRGGVACNHSRWVGRWTIILWGLDTFVRFPNFLKSWVVRQLVRQLVYTVFISNNRASFHLWWKQNLVKHQKVSKYYENDFCFLIFLSIEFNLFVTSMFCSVVSHWQQIHGYVHWFFYVSYM